MFRQGAFFGFWKFGRLDSYIYEFLDGVCVESHIDNFKYCRKPAVVAKEVHSLGGDSAAVNRYAVIYGFCCNVFNQAVLFKIYEVCRGFFGWVDVHSLWVAVGELKKHFKLPFAIEYGVHFIFLGWVGRSFQLRRYPVTWEVVRLAGCRFC